MALIETRVSQNILQRTPHLFDEINGLKLMRLFDFSDDIFVRHEFIMGLLDTYFDQRFLKSITISNDSNVNTVKRNPENSRKKNPPTEI
jgi:hypothetical protein